jgi:transcription elongation factor GreA
MSENWLTQDGYDKLKAELERLSGPWREEIKERIAAAREEGDLKENGGYHAAREEQGKNEARIKQLAKMLENAIVGEPDIVEGVVSQGMKVVVQFAGETAPEEPFLLGSREQNEHTEGIEVYSATSPLGAALLGQEVGSTVSFVMPNGKSQSVTIVSAELYRN